MVFWVILGGIGATVLILSVAFLPTLLADSCMDCGGKALRRARQPGGLEAVLYLACLPYRCEQCTARTFRFRFVNVFSGPRFQRDQSMTAFTTPASRRSQSGKRASMESGRATSVGQPDTSIRPLSM